MLYYISMRFPRSLIWDVLLILFSLAFSIMLVRSGWVEQLLDMTHGIAFLESFVSGMLFTSVFTTAPAIVMLGEIAQEQNALSVALVGALGALIGDMIIFRFVRDRLSNSLIDLLARRKRTSFKNIVQKKVFRWLSPFVAVLIIASPLPDELAASVLGITNIRMRVFIPFSYVANALGILFIGVVARRAAQGF